MAERYTAGPSTITVEQAAFLAALDTVTEGAGSSFMKRARDIMVPIVDEARRMYPRETGGAAAGLMVRDDISPTRLGVTALNEARSRTGYPYGYVLRFSVRTRQSLDMEAMRKGFKGETLTSGEKKSEQFMAVDFARRYGRRASGQDMATRWRARLTKSHGQGAPNEKIAGKRAWDALVKAPAKKGEKTLIEQVRGDLRKLVE